MRLLCYFKSCLEQGILLPSSNLRHLRAYCDFDWASYLMTPHLVTGYLLKLVPAPISWKTKKQATVSRSSVEEEYRAMSNATNEVIWIRNLLKFFSVAVPLARLYCNNQVALHIANNPVFHEHTKHIEVDCHFIREHIASSDIQP